MSAALPVDPALFISDRQFRGPTTRPPQTGFPAHAFNAPTQTPTRYLGPFRPVFCAPKSPRILGRQALHPLPQSAGGSGHFRTLWDRPAGAQKTPPRTGLKLGENPFARPGVVRVPESKNKNVGRAGEKGRGCAIWGGPQTM